MVVARRLIDQIAVFRCSFGQEREEELLFTVVVHLEEAHHVGVVVGDQGAARVVSLRRADEVRGRTERGPEDLVHRGHLGGVGSQGF